MKTLQPDSQLGQPTANGVHDLETTARRIEEFTRICARAAQGDLEARITGVGGDPTWQALAVAINGMLDMADSFVREAAAAMEHCSRDQFHRPILLRGLKGAYRQSACIINAAGLKMKESSDQIRYIAGLASETAANVTTVAAACEELTSTSNEIARQATGAVNLSKEAVSVSQQASQAVDELNTAGKKVESIVKLINKIAGQTNLLALNATIEAARAGEAGKGFAVVAAEVKELSRSTAAATGDISKQMSTMRDAVKTVAQHMGSVGATIERINHGADAISISVGEQVQATSDISRSISGVSENTDLISKRIGDVRRRGDGGHAAPGRT